MAVRKRTKGGKSPAAEAPVEVVVAAEVDERLFLLRRLERLYQDWPSDFSDLDALENAIAELRGRVHRYCEYVKDKDLEPRLTSLYADVDGAVESYGAFVAEVKKILKDAQTRADGGSSGSSIAASALSGGGWESIAIGVGMSLWESYKDAKAVSEATQQAVQAAARDLDKKFTDALSRAQNAAIQLSEKYGWRRGEAGFDLPREQEERLDNLIKAEDFKGALTLLDAIHRRRARDPFAAVARHVVAGQVKFPVKGGDPSELAELAEGCVTAASLVPAGYMYDEDRAYCLYYAAFVATLAALKEYDEKVWGVPGSGLAARAVALWESRDFYVPFDPDVSGEGRQYRALALGLSGEFERALAVGSEIEGLRRDDLLYALTMACVTNHLGRTDDSFKWFEHAVRNIGFNEFKDIEKDENLRAMIRANREKYNALTEVKIGMKINFGFFDDDIVVTNKSAFPLTNVKLSGSVVAAGGDAAKRESVALHADRLGAATPDMSDLSDTHTWVDVISVPGSRIDIEKTLFYFSCDQMGGTWSIKFADDQATKPLLVG
jgi:hypothetical protein